MASKLKRSIHNQLVTTTSPSPPRRLQDCIEERPSKELVLRRLDLLPVLPEVLAQCRPHALYITNLDISFSIATFCTLNLLCKELVNLRVIYAKSCGLSDTLSSVSWPRRLQDLDLSRNELKKCPQGIVELMYLTKLNLSGNRIDFIPTALLKIPCLMKCLLLSNPIHNIPKHICREGVEKMRNFLAVEPLPMPPDILKEEACTESSTGANTQRRNRASSVSNCDDLRRFVLRNQGSLESGYESAHRHPSSSSVSSASTDAEFSEASDTDCDIAVTATWPAFHSGEIPKGYMEMGKSSLCQLYLPEDCVAQVEVHEVRDLSLHPQLADNELLVTPVVRITPHGLRFANKPAIVILPHCTMSNHSQAMHLVPLCSDTRQYQTPEWTSLRSDSHLGLRSDAGLESDSNLRPGSNSDPECEIFEDHIMFATFHFSLFAVAAVFPYPTSRIKVESGVGGELLVPELPGFSVRIPSDSIKPSIGSASLTGTVYYCDESYFSSNYLAPASACIGVEPHGMEFDSPVQISIPIPDYTAIKRHFPEAKLQLWCSEMCPDSGATVPQNWKLVGDGVEISVEKSEDGDLEVVRFATIHFSWYELLWTLCTLPLQKLGLGATNVYNHLSSRARYVAVRFQAFMSQPCRTLGNFGLVVTVYKFGDPLTAPSNYPLLVSDSGSKRLYLRAGDLHVRVEGCFVASQNLSEVLERNGKILDFTGEDFCERFEFALNLKEGVAVPLQEGQVLGKIHFVQWEESTSIHKSFNLISVGNNEGIFLSSMIYVV